MLVLLLQLTASTEKVPLNNNKNNNNNKNEKCLCNNKKIKSS